MCGLSAVSRLCSAVHSERESNVTALLALLLAFLIPSVSVVNVTMYLPINEHV